MSHRSVGSRPWYAALAAMALLLGTAAAGAPARVAGATGPAPRPTTGQEQGGTAQAPGLRPREPRRRAGEAVVLLTPATQRALVGDGIRVQIAVLGAAGITSLPATLRYDPAILRFRSAAAGSAWEGAAPPVVLADASRPGHLVLGVSRLGPRPARIRGVAEIVELRFEALGAGETALGIERFALLGPGHRSQPARAGNATVVVR